MRIQNRTIRAAEPTLFPVPEELRDQTKGLSQDCQIVSVGKRRDGGTRYWCLNHKANATAKYGKPAAKCSASHIQPIREEEVLSLEIDKYQGGIALWGAVPAIYDTTHLPMDRGIHVHARRTLNAKKEMDWTYRAVRLRSKRLPADGMLVSEIDAIYFMVSSVFGYEMKYIPCTYCGHAHLDKDWFSVHPHRRHLCSGCGKHFRDSEIAIGNPISSVRDACGTRPKQPRLSTKRLNINQADFPGGIQVWGSNPAFLWTSENIEDEGIHVHAFRKPGGEPEPDETFGEVTIDGIKLDPEMVRTLMAQSTLPSLKGRITSVDCSFCHNPHFSKGEPAYTPIAKHICARCGRETAASGRLRKTVANPLINILNRLADKAPRKPQQHDLGLMPETL